MPKFNVVRSITIEADRSKVHSIISDFNHWSAWSPWLITEPEAIVKVAEGGKFYQWEGKRVGSGEMTVLAETDHKVDYDLTFLKPWKSKAKVSFILKENGDLTDVSWTMDSSLPFFMFFMKKQMVGFIGMDYERGLNMLKEYIETGEVLTKIDLLGEISYDGCNYIGIKNEASMANFGEVMEEDYGKLMRYTRDQKNTDFGEWFSQYHKFDFANSRVNYTAAVRVNSTIPSLPDGFFTGIIPATKMYSVRHTGAYIHIGNAWSAAHSLMRAKVFKAKKGIHPFEFYINSPKEVEPKDLISEIRFAVK